MTVRELIHLLSQQNPMAEVYCENPFGDADIEVNQVIEGDDGYVFLTI